MSQTKFRAYYQGKLFYNVTCYNDNVLLMEGRTAGMIIHPDLIMESTGLLDITGRRIFVGDVLAILNLRGEIVDYVVIPTKTTHPNGYHEDYYYMGWFVELSGIESKTVRGIVVGFCENFEIPSWPSTKIQQSEITIDFRTEE